MESNTPFFGPVAQPSRASKILTRVTKKQPQPRYRRTANPEPASDVDPETRWSRSKLDQMGRTPK